MFGFPFFTFQQLKDGYPSKAKGRSWKAELKYRNECKDIIVACGPALRLNHHTIQKGVVLLHRCLTRLASTEFDKLDKWALATACVFVATKMDSTYHTLFHLTHASFRALRDQQGRPLEPEYFNPDGSPGNPSFLAPLCQKVRDAEMAVIFAINFDFNVEVPSSMAIYQFRELGLTDAVGDADPQVFAVRATALKICNKSIITPSSVLCLLHPPRHLSLAAISLACKKHGYHIDLLAERHVGGERYVPALTAEQLAAVEAELAKYAGVSSRSGTPAHSGLVGGAAAVANGSVPGTPAGPSAAAAPGTPAAPEAVAPDAAAAATEGRRRSSVDNGEAGPSSAGAHWTDRTEGSTAGAAAEGRRRSSIDNGRAGTSAAVAAAKAVGRQGRSSDVGLPPPPAAAAPTFSSQANGAEGAGPPAAAADAGLADEWFQLLGEGDGAAAPPAAAAEQELGFHKAAGSKAVVVGTSQAAEGSGLDANTVGPRMNNPSPISIDSVRGARGQQQLRQQQGGLGQKRMREDGIQGILSEPLLKRGGMVAA